MIWEPVDCLRIQLYSVSSELYELNELLSGRSGPALFECAPVANRSHSRRRAACSTGSRRARLHRRAHRESTHLFPRSLELLSFNLTTVFFYIYNLLLVAFAQGRNSSCGKPFTIKVEDVCRSFHWCLSTIIFTFHSDMSKRLNEVNNQNSLKDSSKSSSAKIEKRIDIIQTLQLK